MSTTAYKVLTHDYRPPLQGGEPLFTGSYPYTLPVVAVDESDEECSAGWNACADAATALRIAGLWPDGRPSRVIEVVTDAAVFARGDKLRASTWTLVRELDEATEVRDAVRRLSEPFGDLADEMVAEQMAWRRALGRPRRDEAAVVRGLEVALGARGLNWKLSKHDTASAAMDAGDARTAWNARAAWNASDAWAAWNAWAARSAWDAGNALTASYTARRGWVEYSPDLLTVGLRDAYEHGLAVAVPTENDTLGWAMLPAKEGT